MSSIVKLIFIGIPNAPFRAFKGLENRNKQGPFSLLRRKIGQRAVMERERLIRENLLLYFSGKSQLLAV